MTQPALNVMTMKSDRTVSSGVIVSRRHNHNQPQTIDRGIADLMMVKDNYQTENHPPNVVSQAVKQKNMLTLIK